MACELSSAGIPVPEKLLRDLSKDPSRTILEFGGKDRKYSVKQLHDVIDPVLGTAEVPDLSASHQAAACNLLCAIIERCRDSNDAEIRNEILEDSIWLRLFEIYLRRSENTKGKSMRQMLLTLTSVLMKSQSSRSLQLKDQATSTFMKIIYQRRDRLQVKPALQGLAHFLQKGFASIADLVHIESSLRDQEIGPRPTSTVIQDIFRSFLSWIVHHDTSLSAGHLVKSFLGALRNLPSEHESLEDGYSISPLWIEPVVETLNTWQERVQEFQTHVFPHCFAPNMQEYLRFLSYLHFGQHIHSEDPLPTAFKVFDGQINGLTTSEEFAILLAALQTGKEIGIVKDTDGTHGSAVSLQGDILYLQESIFDVWLSNLNPDVRLAGLFLSVYSTSVTKPITRGVLLSLRRNLVHLHTDTDANFRKEVLNHIQRLFERLKGSTGAIVKAKEKKSIQTQTRIPFSKGHVRVVENVSSGSPSDALAGSLEFTLWYTHFLECELRSTASYQRRITALKALTIVLKSGLDPDVPQGHLSKSAQGQLRWAHGLRIINPRLVRLLLDLVLDPFDDIRGASISILELCLDSIPKEIKIDALREIPKVIKRAEAMMLQTGRADHADGVARAYSLLFNQCNADLPDLLLAEPQGLWSKASILAYLTCQLEQTIELAQKDLSLAVNGRPVHGTFAALRYIIDQDSFYAELVHLSQDEFRARKEIHNRIRACFDSLWSCVQPVLCADAPEGHVPEEFDEEASLDTKEILSYSWRGLKEASVLLRTIVSRAPIGNNKISILNPTEVERLGKVCFLQLVELRHRGAHSTVSQTFAAFCRRCMTSGDEKLRALPEAWCRESLLCIQAKAHAITRRSAGIPSLISGILAAEQPAGGPIFIRAFRDIVDEASQDAQSTNIEESRLPQVHALNSIKEIFTTSKLSAASEAYIGEGLGLAARTINSSIWPIRNCGLMLFKALIERLLGSDEAQDWKDQNRTKSSRFSYNKYPHLLSILSNLLDPTGPLQKSMTSTTGTSPMDLHGAEGVFPALQILRQAPPPDPHRQAIAKSVIYLLSSPHWHLRDMAARTLVSLHLPHEYYNAMKMLLQIIEATHNKQHGMLLTLKYMLRQYLLNYTDSMAGDLKSLLANIEAKSPMLWSENNCPFTKAAFIDLFNISRQAVLQQCNSLEQTRKIWPEISPIVQHAEKRAQGDALLQRSFNLHVLMTAMVHEATDNGASPATPDSSNVRKTLTELALNDPDNCCDIVRSFGDILRNTRSIMDPQSQARLLSDIHEIILAANDPEVVTEAQAILAESLFDKDLRGYFFTFIIKDGVTTTIKTLQNRCLESSPSNMQNALRLLCYFLDHAFHPGSSRTAVNVRQIVYYIRILRMTIIDTNPFDARYAAVQSLSALDRIFTYNDSPTSKPLILGLALVLYDLLNDDDDEIRDEAALVTSRLLRAQGFGNPTKRILVQDENGVKWTSLEYERGGDDPVPIITVQRLGRFLAQKYADSKALCREGLRRLTDGKLGRESFANTFTEARKEDTALFTQEKQNLYKDDVLDATFWASVLRSVSPAAILPHYAAELRAWVLDAVSALTQTTENEVDGPLGWTSKAEVFTLGMRVFSAADVLLRWDQREGAEVRLALLRLAAAGKESELNGLWLEKIERVLEDSVVRLVRGVYQGLPAAVV